MAWRAPMILTLTDVPSNFTVELPINDVTGDFQVNWGDSVINTIIRSHNYSTSGTYTIQISVADDNISKITIFGSSSSPWNGYQYLSAIISWGDFNGITTLTRIGGNLLTSVPITVPNTVTNMIFMFDGAINFNQDIGNWNVGQVTNMLGMFYNSRSFNQSLNNWNVGQVTNMLGMFYNADNFNQPLNNWNVGLVTTMSNMFAQASNFNQNIGNWNVSQVTNMSRMFFSAVNFNQPLNNWNVSQVTNMSRMFSEASSFNQDLSDWDVSEVTDMTNMFTGTSLNTTNYSNILIGWSALPLLQTNVVFGGGVSIYQNSTTAYNELISTYNWSITPVPTILPDVKPVSPVIAKKKSFFGGNTFDSSKTNASRYSQIVRGINNGTTRFISNDLNAFGYYSGGPGGSGAPPRNTF